jgi:hypothetical protein
MKRDAGWARCSAIHASSVRLALARSSSFVVPNVGIASPPIARDRPQPREPRNLSDGGKTGNNYAIKLFDEQRIYPIDAANRAVLFMAQQKALKPKGRKF